uniref:Uncharacterized protein n=1 Tax=Rhizophora mucronata TaxID=61149 RepID=A0A2P2IJT1_RHIMU
MKQLSGDREKRNKPAQKFQDQFLLSSHAS